MIKRFIDSDLFTKRWFRQLTAEEKCLWFCITQTCTYDGFWEYDEEAVAFLCNGYKGEIPEIIVSKLGMVQVDDYQYFLPGWVKFQYGVLKPQVRPHQRIIKRLVTKGLDEKFPELIEKKDNNPYETQ